MGLNTALASIGGNTESKTPLESPPTEESGCESLGIPDTVLVPSLRSASLRRLGYSDGAYVAHTTV